jgi:zinc protease
MAYIIHPIAYEPPKKGKLMRFTTFILFLLALSCFPLPAAAKLFNAESFTLDNGLQVVVIPNHRAPVVTHMIWYKFGAADEDRGKSGIAHFLEHLMFKGTDLIPDGQFSKIVKQLGGNDNAFTAHDYTAYYQNMPRAHLARVMEMESDRMKNLELRDSEVSSERQVIIEERRQRIENTPQAKFQEQVMSALFVNHPYAIPVIGWLHEIKELTRDDAFEYYNKWYAPNNAILVVSGDITASELKPLAKKYYGVIPPQMIPERVRTRPAPIVAEQRLILQDPRIGTPTIMKIYRAPRGKEALEILSEIFGGNSTSRLYRHLVIDQKLAVSAGAGYDGISLNETTFTLYANPAPGVALNKLEEAMDLEIVALLDKGVTLEELTAAKSRKQASMIYYLDSLQGPALLFGRALANGFTINHIENRDQEIEKLTIEDINQATKDLFRNPDLPVTGLLLPGQSKNPVKPEAK